jgi:peptidoglycan/xylan/chitin deacetylase (PgdA/CDA1 family)
MIHPVMDEGDVVRVVLTHDVDWPIQGPGRDHVLARRDRFDEDVVRRVIEEGYNPYYNVPDLMEIEERHGLRSTFFFRPVYDDGTPVDCYGPVMRELSAGGWEVGVHLNDAGSAESVAAQRRAIEGVLGGPVAGARVHYLNAGPGYLRHLEAAGLRYDSSVSYNKRELDPRNMGFLRSGNMVVFPITLMDAYMFTYMGVDEEGAVGTVDRAIGIARWSGRRFLTILWHDNSLRMRGGRAYRRVAEHLASRDDVRVLRMIDAYGEVAGVADGRAQDPRDRRRRDGRGQLREGAEVRGVPGRREALHRGHRVQPVPHRVPGVGRRDKDPQAQRPGVRGRPPGDNKGARDRVPPPTP